MRVPAGPEPSRSRAPLLSRSAGSRRREPGVASAGTAGHWATRSRSHTPSLQLVRHTSPAASRVTTSSVPSAFRSPRVTLTTRSADSQAGHAPNRPACRFSSGCTFPAASSRTASGSPSTSRSPPGEAAQAGHLRERPHGPPRAVGVVAQHPRRRGHRTVDDVDVAVHLDVRRPGAVPGERVRRGVVRRPRGHLLELAVLALREEAKSSRSDQGEVHAIVAVPVQRKQGLRRGPRPGRISRKRENRTPHHPNPRLARSRRRSRQSPASRSRRHALSP